jgi:chromosome segregation ATPase
LVVQKNARVAELVEANAQLRAELNAAQSRLAEVEHCEQALTSDYEGLRRDFDILCTSDDGVVKEKADPEKTEHEKAQWLRNSLHKKLAELQVDMEAIVAALGGRCMDFPSTNTTVNKILEWFRTEVQALPTTFAECNENITCYTLIGVFKMLAGVECEQLLELKNLALSCDESLLHDFPDDVGLIAKKLVKN